MLGSAQAPQAVEASTILSALPSDEVAALLCSSCREIRAGTAEDFQLEA